MTFWLVLVPLLPILAAPIALGAARRRGPAAGWAIVAALGGSLAILVALAGEPRRADATWFEVGGLELTASLALDGLSAWTAILVAAVALVVNAYAVGFVGSEAGAGRFFAWMGLFAGAMLALVLAGSFVVLFAAWEAVGLASFALIASGRDRAEARRAARQALLTTRAADFGLLLGWLLVLVETGSTDLAAFRSAVEAGRFEPSQLTPIAILFLAAAIGKSAQLPLSAWLPRAMAGPAPVSALLHSATMVAAGVYLVLRLYPIFERAPVVLDVALWVGAVTAIAAAVVATSRLDLKEVLAWSTVSQLGEMFLALGLGAATGAAFHLTTHAVFKSGLFLCAGVFERRTGSHDLARIAGAARTAPLAAGAFVVLALALAGLPPLAGFWSAEPILAAARARHAGWALVLVVSIGLAGVYAGRAAAALFASRPGGAEPAGRRSEAILVGPVLFLAAVAIGIGIALRGPAGSALDLEAVGDGPGAWRWVAIAASAGGLALGALAVRRRGTAPALGPAPAAFAGSLQRLSIVPARLALGVAPAARGLEAALDVAAGRIAAGVRALARAEGPLERGLDSLARRAGLGALLWAGGVDRVEGEAFGRGGDRLALGTILWAGGVERVEGAVFGRGGDRLARGLAGAGDRLRGFHAGRIYRYTMSLFVWVLATLLVVSILAL